MAQVLGWGLILRSAMRYTGIVYMVWLRAVNDVRLRAFGTLSLALLLASGGYAGTPAQAAPALPTELLGPLGALALALLGLWAFVKVEPWLVAGPIHRQIVTRMEEQHNKELSRLAEQHTREVTMLLSNLNEWKAMAQRIDNDADVAVEEAEDVVRQVTKAVQKPRRATGGSNAGN